jgi:hypothetical protein
MRSDGYPTGLRIASFLSYCISLFFLPIFLEILVRFTCFFSYLLTSSGLILSSCALYLLSRYFASSFVLFQFYLTINLFNILEYLLR